MNAVLLHLVAADLNVCAKRAVFTLSLRPVVINSDLWTVGNIGSVQL